MSTKLLLINSFGPMGSSLLSPVAEKLGFSNMPVRKLGLSQYLMGKVEVNSGVMQGHIERIIGQHSQPRVTGGVSTFTQKNQEAYALTHCTDETREALQDLKAQKFESVQALYSAARKLYYDAVIYKQIDSNPDWHIEMTVDIHRYDPAAIYEAYKAGFDEVYMIHLTRDFRSWINSLSSQHLKHPELKNRVKFFPHLRYRDYKLYHDAVAQMPGLTIPFDDIFTTPTQELAQKIAALTGAEMPDLDFEAEEYDLYGKSLPHGVAFKKFDDNMSYLRPYALDYIERAVHSGRLERSVLTQGIAWGVYLIDLITGFQPKKL